MQCEYKILELLCKIIFITLKKSKATVCILDYNLLMDTILDCNSFLYEVVHNILDEGTN
jgi:hypothetical protein